MKDIVVLVDNYHLSTWQIRVLEILQKEHSISILSCVNTTNKVHYFKNFFYYVLNLLALRNKQSRTSDFRGQAISFRDLGEFEAEHEGNWQRIPDTVLSKIRAIDPAFIVKFGMGLLRVPDGQTCKAPILSWHHGDPRTYRGRPAGFYEIVNGENLAGQIVQKLSNTLDGGRVLAFGQTKVYPYSYRKTNQEALFHSPGMIHEALRNLETGRPGFDGRLGRNYKLPSNITVVVFGMAMAFRKLGHIIFGLFFEKRWAVAVMQSDLAIDQLLADPTILRAAESRKLLTVPPGYTFAADPFPLGGSGQLLAEALNARSGLGEVITYRAPFEGDGHPARIHTPADSGHFSFPAGIEDHGTWYVVPETADWSPPMIMQMEQDSLVQKAFLNLPEDVRLVDPVLHTHKGRVYLFGNTLESGAHTLWLWSAAAIDQQFEAHPASPILISPIGARMGGSIIEESGRLFRLGQDFSGEYGDGVVLFEIMELDKAGYREEFRSKSKFDNPAGPHTLNRIPQGYAFDLYRTKFSPLAGVRRLRALLRRDRRKISALT